MFKEWLTNIPFTRDIAVGNLWIISIRLLN